MSKAVKIFILGLVVLFSTTAAAVSCGLVSLTGTEWQGSDVTTITTTSGAVAAPIEVTITFGAGSSTYGILTVGSNPAVNFSALKSGTSLTIVGAPLPTATSASYIINAQVIPGCKPRNKPALPATMNITGISLTDGSQFTGTLTEE